jgi:hypothetical protein
MNGNGERGNRRDGETEIDGESPGLSHRVAPVFEKFSSRELEDRMEAKAMRIRIRLRRRIRAERCASSAAVQNLDRSRRVKPSQGGFLNLRFTNDDLRGFEAVGRGQSSAFALLRRDKRSVAPGPSHSDGGQRKTEDGERREIAARFGRIFQFFADFLIKILRGGQIACFSKETYLPDTIMKTAGAEDFEVRDRRDAYPAEAASTRTGIGLRVATARQAPQRGMPTVESSNRLGLWAIHP